ncbi:MAG TPA: hypothetical protein VIO61_05020 [Anaerolineaceae bacterium]
MTDNNSFDGFDEEVVAPETTTTTAKPNRNFILALGILGGLFIIAVIAMVIAALVILPNQRKAQEAKVVSVNATNEARSVQATSVRNTDIVRSTEAAKAAIKTATPTATVPVDTPAPSPTIAIQAPGTPTATSVVAQPTASPTTAQETPVVPEARTATLSALLTLAAQGKLTATALGTPVSSGITPTATALPDTGIADGMGLPALFGIGLALIIVIIIVRGTRMRANAA